MIRAALFDMDRTLLRIDSAFSWVKFLRARGDLSAVMLGKAIYWSSLYKLALLDMQTVFGRLVADLAGDPEAEMVAKCAEWYARHVEPEIALPARVAVEARRAAGELVCLATGLTIYAARPVAAALGIEHVLASRPEVGPDGLFTGRATAMSFGHHKVAMAEAWAAEHGVDLDASAFYSDSYNDLPLLARVGEPVAVNPDPRLLRHARARGWRIARWR